MPDVKFTKEDYEKLIAIPANAYLLKSEEEKYNYFKKHDPFPSIPDALLNSIDIVKYVLTIGMIQPFDPESLDGATYTCNFSGKYICDDNGKLKEGTGELTLPPNSIAFLEMEPIFRIPEYLILRFNLKVKHVYKGLLLGTGPIIDPGYQGKLHIPLHNLTSNEYIIKKGAQIISIEFTKLSCYEQRSFNNINALQNIGSSLDFSTVPYVFRVFEPRDVMKYILKALTGDHLFRKSNSDKKSDLLSVGSSIPETIKQAEKNAKKAATALNKIKWVITIAGIISVIAIIIAAVSSVSAIYNLINGVNTRIDKIISENASLNNKYDELTQENKNLKDMILDLHSIPNNIQQINKDKNTTSKQSGGKNK